LAGVVNARPKAAPNPQTVAVARRGLLTQGMPATPAKPSLLARRWRVILAAAVGLGVGFAGYGWLHWLSGFACLVGWNAAGLLYLATTGWMLWRDDEATVRRRAGYEDEGQSLTQAIVISAVVASLGATVLAMHESKAASAHSPIAPAWAWVFSISTLIVGWLIMQTVFALHYAHRYFGDDNRDGRVDGGVEFPGAGPKTYHEFVYMAVCIGASGQVSDFNIVTTPFRRLVTVHALLAFFFNTMILALGINIFATILSS
jgi:uncharacterized membrane protein